MRLALYSSVLRSTAPNLVSIQDERLDVMPTVLVCPFRPTAELTDFRVEVPWRDSTFVACPDLTRPIRRAGLRFMGHLDEASSQAIVSNFQHLLAR